MASKSERFQKHAVERTNRAVRAMRDIARCGDRGRYEYTRAAVNQIINRLHLEMANLELAFRSPLGEFALVEPQPLVGGNGRLAETPLEDQPLFQDEEAPR